MELRLYFQLFWIPAVASGVLMALAWVQEGLSPRAQALYGVWFLLALSAQYVGAPAGPAWVTGLVLQTMLGVFLLLKRQVTRL